MARNGSGTYSLPATMATSGATASSVTVNSIMNDIAQALTDSINKDGTKAFAASQSMGGNRLTSLGAATALTDAAQYSQLQKGNVNRATTVGGTVDAITLQFTPTITSLTTGMTIRWVSAGENTIVAPTINVDTLGAIALKKNPGAVALQVGDLGPSGTENTAVYNGTNWVLVTNAAATTFLSAAATVDRVNGAYTAGSLRWQWGAFGATESGSNVGSDFAIKRYSDAGSVLGTALSIARATGVTTMENVISSGYSVSNASPGAPAFVMPNDISGAKWAMTLGGSALTFLNDNSTNELGTGNITYNSTTYYPKVRFTSTGSILVKTLAYTLLGTITTTSGTSQSLGSLTLTGYKFLRLVFTGVSHNAGSSTSFSVNSSQVTPAVTAATAVRGMVEIELSTGTGFATIDTAGPSGNFYVFASTVTTATTTITIAPSTASFDAGSVTVYGVL